MGEPTHRRIVAGSLGAAHAAGGRPMKPLLHDQIDGRKLPSLQDTTAAQTLLYTPPIYTPPAQNGV